MENETYITPEMNTAQNTPPALGALNGYTGFHLRIAQIKVFKNFEAQLGELGVSPAIFSALEIVHLNPGITQSTLAKAIHLDHSSMVPLLDKLSSRGLLLRETSTTDRRHKMISLTDAGRELHTRAAARVAEHERANQSALTVEERREFFRLLVKFCKISP